MSRENFRHELERAFEAMSGPPSPALSARVRSALSESAPARQGSFWAAGLPAALIAAIVIGVFVVLNFNRHQTGVLPGGLPSPSPSAVATAPRTATPSPVPQQTPPDSSLPAFVCSSASALTGSQSPTVAYVDAIRTGSHTAYDRVTIEFNNGEPVKVELTPQSSAQFTQGASGRPVTLAGNAGILVTIRGADEHTAYNGPTDFKTGYPVLLEAQQVQDFEGVVQWGLGLSKPACYRAFFLTNPVRLVIDIQVS